MEEQAVNNLVQQTNVQPQVPQEPKPHSFLRSKLFLITLVMAVLFTIIYAGIYLYLGSQLDQISKSNQAATITQPSPTPDETANWKTYTNASWNYQFQYPSTWIVDEQDIDHVIITSPDIEKSVDGRIIKFPANYIRVNIIKRENVTSSFEEEIKSVYTESPQCSVDSECPSSPPLIMEKTNANSLEYYFFTTGVYNNELAIFPLPKDKNNYILINPRRALVSNIKLPDKMLSTFKFTDQDNDNIVSIDFSVCGPTRQRVDVAFGSTTFEINGKNI